MQSEVLNILDRINDTVIALDKEGKITYVNKAFAEVAGLEPSKMIGKKIWVLLPRLAESIVHKNVNEATETNQNMVFEWRGPYTNRIWETKIFPFGEGIVAIGREITERKNGEEVLRENKERLEVAQRVAHVGYWEYYGKTDEAIWSKELFRIFGLKQSKAPNMGEYRKLICPECLDELDGRMQKFFAVGKLGDIISFDYSIKRPNGSIRFLHTERLIREVDDSGKLKRMMGIEQDITERKLMEQKIEGYSKHLEQLVEERTRQLKDSERLATIGATAGMVGHDIRNPLQAMTSDIYLARSDLDLVPDGNAKQGIRESLESIENNIDYVNKIVQDLQDYARPLVPALKQIATESLLNEVSVMRVIPSDIELSCKIDSGAEKVVADPDMLKRILANLVNNAVQAMPNGGKLFIRAFKKASNIIVSVEDTGAGIPEEVKDKLFTPLFTTKAKGQGFGLAVVKRMTEAMEGKVTFESKEGKGTKFLIELPFSE
jgi:PAS domain S-box-containing protein